MLKKLTARLFGAKPIPSMEEKLPTLEVILIDDSELAVVGEEAEIDSYLFQLAEYNQGKPFEINRLVNGSTVTKVANAAQEAVELSKQSTRWIKLTEQSAKQVKAAGLIPTKVPGVSYGATGKPGAVDKWLQFESSGGLLSNPAVMASVASMVAQMAMSSELAAMKELLKSIDQKLDSIARHQRDVQLAKLDRVAFALRDANIRAEAQGGVVNSLTWSQIQGESAVIDEVQGMALRSIESLVESSRDAGLKELGKMAGKLGQDSSVWISVLGRTLELRDELAILELSRSDSMDQDEALNHRSSVRKALAERRELIGSAVEKFAHQLRELSPAAFEAVVLHAPSSRKLVNGLNAALEITSQFGQALGKDIEVPTLEPVPWVRAALDKAQRRAAVTQVVDPIVDTAKDVVQVTKEKIEEIREELKRNEK